MLPDMKQTSAVEELALDHLHYIRRALEVSTAFTAVPGKGGIVMGCIGLAAGAMVLARGPEHTLSTWLLAAPFAVLAAVVALLRKAAQVGASLHRGAGRRFLFGLVPPLLVGAVLTWALMDTGVSHIVPGVWLLLFGTAVLSAGAYSVRIVPVLGLCFMALGLLALVTPPTLGNLWLSAGFGGLNLGFGFWIARHHGG